MNKENEILSGYQQMLKSLGDIPVLTMQVLGLIEIII